MRLFQAVRWIVLAIVHAVRWVYFIIQRARLRWVTMSQRRMVRLLWTHHLGIWPWGYPRQRGSRWNRLMRYRRPGDPTIVFRTPDLRGVDLRQISFPEKFEFASGTDLTGAILSGVIFSREVDSYRPRCRVSFLEAKLRGHSLIGQYLKDWTSYIQISHVRI